MNTDQIPVLVGCGQLTERSSEGEGRLPTEMMAEAVRLAAEDAGAAGDLLKDVDTIAAVSLTVDAPEAANPMSGTFSNVPKTVANLLAIEPANYYYSTTGGNTPQMLVNHFSEQIAQGHARTVLLTGGEALQTMMLRFKQQLPLDEWHDNPGGKPTSIGDGRAPVNEHEAGYGLAVPSNTYPLFENALRGKYQRTPTEHQQAMGEVYQDLNKVAANNPLAWFPRARSAQEICTVSPDNRYVGYPYTKLLNSIIQVNQGAALILTTEANAKKMEIAQDKLVYLHGCADANDIWHLSERANYHSSPALKEIARQSLGMAQRDISEIDHFDIYSCFPSALEIACDELGISHQDPRGLTVTGGLPYFGGAGNNYSMHAIAEMMTKLRDKPGSFGLLNANGWFVTKHSMGIYSSQPFTRPWQRAAKEDYQAKILEQVIPAFTETPQGEARIETYTVLHDHSGPRSAIVIGRLADDTRFISETPKSAEVFTALMEEEPLNLKGHVSQQDGKNVFTPG